MAQGVVPIGKATRDCAAMRHAMTDEPSHSSHASQSDHMKKASLTALRLLTQHLSQYRILLLERSSSQAKAFLVDDKGGALQEVDLQNLKELLKSSYSKVEPLSTVPQSDDSDCDRNRNTEHLGCARRSSGLAIDRLTDRSKSQRRKRPAVRPSYSPPDKRPKRQHDAAAGAQTESEELDTDSENEKLVNLDNKKAVIQKTVPVARLGDDYYIQAFKLIGQLGCKDIVKAWIKFCHPKKQSTHPYNGGKEKGTSKDDQGAQTAPEYWPLQDGWRSGNGCRHREPDHIKRPERLILLKHLLRCGHRYFALDKLRLATRHIERNIPINFTKGTVKMLKQIYDARAMEIQYEHGKISGDTTIDVLMPRPSIKPQKTPRSKTLAFTPNRRAEQGSSNVMGISESTAGIPAAVGLKHEHPTTGRIGPDTEQKVDLIDADSPNSTSSTTSTLSGMFNSTFTQAYGRQPQTALSIPGVQPHNPIQTQGEHQADVVQNHFQQIHGTTVSNDRRENLGFACDSKVFPKPVVFNRCGASRAEISRVDQGRKNAGTTGSFSIETPRKAGNSAEQYNHQQVGAPQLSFVADNILRPSSHLMGLSKPAVTTKPFRFSGSSSGLAGLPVDSEWSSNCDAWISQQFETSNTAFTGSADPTTLFQPYSSTLTSSFGSDFSETSNDNGLQTDFCNEQFQMSCSKNEQALESELQKQYMTYLPSSLNTLSMKSTYHSDYAST
ncbi:hypothetical protein ACLMJK_009621 [Lecanora helva]